MVRAANRDVDIGIVTSWHTARFALNGYADKGRLAGSNKLADILSTANKADAPHRRSTWADSHAFFGRLRAQGFPIETKH